MVINFFVMILELTLCSVLEKVQFKTFMLCLLGTFYPHRMIIPHSPRAAG